MVRSQYTFDYRDLQGAPGLAEIASILEAIDASALVARLEAYRWKGTRWRGRRGFSPSAFWRAYVASFILNLSSTNALLRRLQDDPALRQLCGFTDLPHRTTFNRFISRLSRHEDLVAGCLADVADKLAEVLPGFGEKVAIDSSTVRTHAHPRGKSADSDPDASWTAKKDNRGASEYQFGYKYHLIADATYGIPIVGFTTTASRNDAPTLPPLLDHAASLIDWWAPAHVMADRGYDSEANHQAVTARGAIPIIGIRTSQSSERLHEGIYDNDGAPTCLGLRSMEYVRSDPQKGYLYRCPQDGCELSKRRGVRHCRDQVWENRTDNLRLFGKIRRGSQEWKDLYGMRWSVERVFKSLKQSRRLEGHCVRGLRAISLHSTMSALSFAATSLARVHAGQADALRWMVQKVA